MSPEMEEYNHYMAIPQMIAVSTLIDVRIRETGTLMERVKELEDAIASALRIKQLWGPPDDVENLLYSGPDDNVADEFRALHSMLTKFEELVK